MDFLLQSNKSGSTQALRVGEIIGVSESNSLFWAKFEKADSQPSHSQPAPSFSERVWGVSLSSHAASSTPCALAVSCRNVLYPFTSMLQWIVIFEVPNQSNHLGSELDMLESKGGPLKR